MELLERLGGREAVTEGVVETFLRLNAVPRPSWHEEAESALLAAELEGLGLTPVRDRWHNLRCDVPAAPGREGPPSSSSRGIWIWCAPAPGASRPWRRSPPPG